MVRRWLCWLLALLGALAFRVSYTGALAGFVLWGTVCLPLLGVLSGLPGVLSAKIELSPQSPRVKRGAAAGWRLAGRSALGLPLGRVKVSVKTVNEMNGLVEQRKQTFFLPGTGAHVDLPVPGEHCGLLTGRVVHAWALDALGLFWLPLRRGGPAGLWVEPIPQRTGLPPLPEEERPSLRPRPGGGPGEDYDPREYRPGDPLSAVHWKLSAKRDALITKETLETVRALPLLTMDPFGEPEELDRLLDLFTGVSGALLEKGWPHAVLWLDPASGEERRFSIAGEKDLEECLRVLLSHRAPRTGKSALDRAGTEKSLYLKPGAEGGGEG